jgi:hypothetical protein
MVAEGRHYEYAKGGTAFSTVQANRGAVASVAMVGVGIDLLKYGVPSDALSNPCTVTMKVSYSITAQGGSSSQAWLIVRMSPQLSTYEVSGTDKLPVKSGIKTFTWTGTVEELITNNYALVETQTHTQTGQAVAQAYVSCITISFPQTDG